MADDVALDERPRRGWYVRKRRLGSDTYLVYLHRISRIGAFSEQVWDACDGTRTVTALSREVGRLHPALPPAAVLGLVVQNLVRFRALGLVEPNPASPPMAPRLHDLMQALHRDPAEPWDAGLADALRRAVEARFALILYEAFRSRVQPGPGGPSPEEHAEVLAGRFAADPRGAAAEVRERYGVRWWRFSPSSAQITVRFDRSVYTGDVHHRH